jgi:valyl-tRNA synthetase
MTKDFTIICPPPNITGELHTGHALVIALQNFFVYSNRILGNNSFVLPGYDHGGIGTQVMAMKKGGITSEDPELFEKVKDFAEESKSSIKFQMEILNLQAEHKYENYTFDPFHSDFVRRSFIRLYDQGYIKREKKIVNFDTKMKTAISDLEVTYEERNAYLYYIAYEIDGGAIEVATTRPETIFADCALAVHPDDKRYLNTPSHARIPLTGKWIPIIRDSYVDMSFGTGVLKITPAHDKNDWDIGRRHSLDAINIIDAEGKITCDYGEINGLAVTDARKKIVGILGCKSIPIVHPVPISVSGGGLVEYLLQDQWFLDMKHAAEKAMCHYPQIEPEIWRENYLSWLKSIEPWCLSRNIVWGHRIPVWYLGDQHIVSLESPGEEWEMSKETLDTWFSSSLWPLSYKEKYGIYPTDLLITAYDILFFWVARMVMMSLLLDDSLPFHKVYIHQLVRDSNGVKMSKTRGNVVNPLDVINKHGLDAMNFALLSLVSPNSKIRFGDEALLESKKIMTKIRNLNNYLNMDRQRETEETCPMLDSYFKSRLVGLEKKFRSRIEALQIHIIRHEIVDFLYELCDWMIEADKIFVTPVREIFFYFKKMLHPFFPKLVEEMSFKNEWSSYEENSSEFPQIKNVITKIRHLKKLKVEVQIKNSLNSYFVSKMCGISEGKSGNFPCYGEVIHILNSHLLKKETYSLNKKLERLQSFFCHDTSKIDSVLVEKRRKEMEEIQLEIKSLEDIINV